MTPALLVAFTIMSGAEDGTKLEYNLRDGEWDKDHKVWRLSIGRREDCDIQLASDTSVSRHHADIVYADTTWWIEDLKSTNGTFLEGPSSIFKPRRLEGKTVVQLGQRFRIGRTWLCFSILENIDS